MLTLRGQLRDEGEGSVENAGPCGGGTWRTVFIARDGT